MLTVLASGLHNSRLAIVPPYPTAPIIFIHKQSYPLKLMKLFDVF